MSRKYIDCRAYPSDIGCTLAICADTEEELLEAAVAHAVAVHSHTDTPQFRSLLRTLLKDGTPPLGAPAQAQETVK
jgi:predicted small metal-binding protein